MFGKLFLLHSQGLLEVRTVNAPFYRYALEATATSMTFQNASIPAAMHSLESNLLSIFNPASLQWPAIVRLYWSSINYKPPPPSPMPTSLARPPIVIEYAPTQLISRVGVVLVSLTCILLAMLCVWKIWDSCLVMMRTPDGWIPSTGMPGVGPLTTLVVTGARAEACNIIHEQGVIVHTFSGYCSLGARMTLPLIWSFLEYYSLSVTIAVLPQLIEGFVLSIIGV